MKSGRSRGSALKRFPVSQWLSLALVTFMAVTAAVFVGALLGFVPTFSAKAAASASVTQGVLIYVNSTGDGGNLVGVPNCDADLGTPGEQCTLRAAIQVANLSPGDDGIEFAIPSTEPFCNPLGQCVINLTRELPALSTGMQIFGPGIDYLTVRRDIGTGYGIFTVTATGAVSVSGMTISNGSSNSDGGALENVNNGTVQITACLIKDNFGNDAGGISNSSGGTININDSTLTGNASDVAGALYNKNTGTININNSTITANTSNRFGGGGIYSQGGIVNIIGSVVSNNRSQARGGGGIKNVGGIVNITSSTITNNFDEFDAGGGIYNQVGTVNLLHSTLSGNTAATDGAGIYNQENASVVIRNCSLIGNVAKPTDRGGSGGAIYNRGSLTVSNSTFSGNTGVSGGAIYNSGSANVTNTTISNNTTFGARFNEGDGAGIENRSTQPVLIKSSLIALNISPGPHPDAFGGFISFGFNLIGKVDGAVGFGAITDQTGTVAAPLDPKLDPAGLLSNGGPTKTIALLCGSPAVDKGGAGLAVILSTDQRGTGFPRSTDDTGVVNATGGDGSDIGAYELQQICSVPAPIIGGAGSILASESCPPVNNAVDPGERVTVNLALTNTGNGPTANLIATLQSSANVIAPSGPMNYGALVSGTVMSRAFSFTADGNCGNTIPLTLQLQDGTTNLGTVTYTVQLGPQGGSCSTSCATPRVLITNVSLTRQGQNVVAAISIQNQGITAATVVTLTQATLSSPTNDGQPLPQNLSTLAPGQTATASVTFTNPGTGNRLLRLRGIYNGGSVFTRNQNVTLP